MNEEDLKSLLELMDKAIKSQHYDIAANLRDARDKLKKRLNSKWVDNVLEQIKIDNDI